MSRIPLQALKLSDTAYRQLIDNSTVLEKAAGSIKVYRLADKTILKLFRVKPLLSSATVRPYSHRFVNNAYSLKSKGIPTLEPLAIYTVPSIKHAAVQYEPLAGRTLRQVITEGNFDQTLATKLGKFIALLHERGIYFRSLHLGNIVLTPDNDLGLIDVADMSVKNRSLTGNERLRNFKHLFRYKDDKKALGSEYLFELIQGYLDNALLGPGKSTAIGRKLIALSTIKP